MLEVGVLAASGDLLRYIDGHGHTHKFGEEILAIVFEVRLFEVLHGFGELFHVLFGLGFLGGVLLAFGDVLALLASPVELGHILEHDGVGLRVLDLHAFIAIFLIEGDGEKAAVVDDEVEEFLFSDVDEGVDAFVEFFLSCEGEASKVVGRGGVDVDEGVAEMLCQVVLLGGQCRRLEIYSITLSRH